MPLTLVRCSRWLSRLKLRNPNNIHYSLLHFSTTTETPSSRASTHNGPARTGPPPIRVDLTERAGRGVFATRDIRAGELIHTAKPIVSHPSLSAIGTVCYLCLKRLTPMASGDKKLVVFCGRKCEENAKVFSGIESKADWSEFDAFCLMYHLKYPLLVKRLACMVVSGAVSAESLDILQPANLSHEMVSEMEKGFELLRSSFVRTNIGGEQVAFLTKQWYDGVMARIRINAFRIELALGLYEDLLLSAAACVESEAAVGNSVYMLPSFYNHDCDPNAHIIWIENSDARMKALRDVDAGEELKICYIDASMNRDARQSLLLHGFGFRCICLRCTSGDY